MSVDWFDVFVVIRSNYVCVIVIRRKLKKRMTVSWWAEKNLCWCWTKIQERRFSKRIGNWKAFIKWILHRVSDEGNTCESLCERVYCNNTLNCNKFTDAEVTYDRLMKQARESAKKQGSNGMCTKLRAFVDPFPFKKKIDKEPLFW